MLTLGISDAFKFGPEGIVLPDRFTLTLELVLTLLASLVQKYKF
jgi:hypothetical protein